MSAEASLLPRIAVRGRSFMALVLAPEAPLGAWLEGLDRHLANSAGFFTGRPVIANLAGAGAAAPEALDGLDARGLWLVGIEGVDAGVLEGSRWAQLPVLGQGHDLRRSLMTDRPVAAPQPAETPAPRPTAPSLLIEGPVRSGQSILADEGDVIVVGAVASGAEVIAGGSIHVYGALRGRAIAGVREGGEARIFCQRLEAELVAVDHLYRTAENWGPGLHGAAVQIRREDRSLRLSPLA